MRVLLLADDCNPEWPSLPIVGYKTCRAIADHADVTVATHVRNRESLERHGFGRAEVLYFDNEAVAAPLYRLATRLRRGNELNWSVAIAMAYPSLLAFDWLVWRHFRGPLREGAFDVVHRVTPMSPTLPSLLPKRCPVPFVLGPVNGGLDWPPGFRAELRREREHLRALRDFYKLLPYRRSTYRHAAAVLASFGHTIADLPAETRPRIIDFPEVGIDPELFSDPGERPDRGHVTFLSAGRFVPYKCFDVAIRAFAESDALRRHRLVLVGDGPERAALEQQVREAELEKVVSFAGWRSQREVGELMRQADVFLFPSIRELGAGVVVEAMACGAVPVVVDYGGPAGLVTDDCGWRVPLGDKDALTRAFVPVLERAAADPGLRRRKARAARERALAHFTWDAKARKILEVYEWVLGRRSKPRFGGSPEATESGR